MLLLIPCLRAAAEERRLSLSLAQAVEQALRTDPQVLSAVVGRDRSQLALLRAQLDRVSVKVDASLQEQYRIGNLLGDTVPDSCQAGLPVPGTDLIAQAQLFSLNPTTFQEQCRGLPGGQYVPGYGVTTSAIGLFNLSASLTVPIFSGFRVGANVARARYTKEAAQAGIRLSQRNVALDVLRSYWGIRRVELQLGVSRQALSRYDDAVKVVQARVRAGLAPPADLNRMETRRQRELARQADLDGSAREGRVQLAVALGLPGAELVLDEEPVVPTAPPADPAAVDRLLADAQGGRQEMLASRRQTQAAQETVRMARSGYFPQLSGVALFQFGNNPFNPLLGSRSANDNPNPFTNVTGSLFLGASLTLNLFDTLNTYTAVRDARYEVARLEQEQRRLGRLVEADVRTVNARLLKLYATRQPLQRTAELARDTLDIIERRYRNGDALILDFLDAELDLLNAEIDLANSTALIASTWGELWAATGRIPGSTR